MVAAACDHQLKDARAARGNKRHGVDHLYSTALVVDASSAKPEQVDVIQVI